jgi:hypothetical protein
MSVGSVKQQQGNRDVFGGKQFESVDYYGPTLYNNTGVGSTSGDSMVPSQFGFYNTILTPFGSGNLDQSGTYYVRWQPQQNGITPWKLRWFVVATNAEVANGVALNTFVVKLAALGY